MTYPFASLWRLRRVPVAAAAMIALWCAAGTAAASESGTVELVTSFVRDYVTFDHAGGTVTGGILRGTTTVTGSSGGPFAEGESNLVVCLVYSGADDAVERVGVRCLDDTCAAAFARFFRSGEATVNIAALNLLGSRRGVILVVEEASTDNVDVHVYGGWLDHSLFATEAVLLKSDIFPDQGATVALSYSFGFSTGENPRAAEDTARWEGLMIGREMRASPSRGQVIRGDADVTVEFGTSAITADVEFTDIANVETGERRDDIVWRGMAVENGGFGRRNAPDDTKSGRFYGPSEEEVGGIFERDGVAGAFGGKRAPT